MLISYFVNVMMIIMHIFFDRWDRRPPGLPIESWITNRTKRYQLWKLWTQIFYFRNYVMPLQTKQIIFQQVCFQKKTMNLQSNAHWKLHYPHKCWMTFADIFFSINLYTSRGCVRCSIGRKIKSCLCIHFSLHINTQIIKHFCKIKNKEHKSYENFNVMNSLFPRIYDKNHIFHSLLKYTHKMLHLNILSW